MKTGMRTPGRRREAIGAAFDAGRHNDTIALREYYDMIAPRLSEYRKKNSYYYELLAKLLKFLIPEGMRVLDLGCGQGDMLDTLRPSYGRGVDISANVVDVARTRHPHLHFTTGDIEDVDVAGGPFDYIVLSNVVGYLRDIQGCLRRLKRYAHPGTRIVIISYNFLWEPLLKAAERLHMKMQEPFLNWLSPGDLVNLLQLEGYDLVSQRQAVLLPKRIPAVSAFLNRYAAHLPGIRHLALMNAVVARPEAAASDRFERTCSVIVPARNEKGNIEAIIRRIPDLGTHTEILFVEGHSGDGTLEEIRRVAAAYRARDIKVLQQDGVGKADAVRKGFAEAKGDVLIILDADLTVHPEDLSRFYDAITSGRAELAIGSRLVYRPQKDSMRFLNMIGNKFFSTAFSFLLRQRIKDTLCGTKALLRSNYRIIMRQRAYFGELDPFGDFDLVFGAAKANLRIMEIPVRYHARTYGKTQISRFKHGALLFRMLCTAVRKLQFVE